MVLRVLILTNVHDDTVQHVDEGGRTRKRSTILPRDSIAVLESKISTLQVRMDAQKDLLRGDQKAATDALEEQLRKAISDAEEQKRRERVTRDELGTMKDELEREREIVIELSEVRREEDEIFFFDFYFLYCCSFFCCFVE